MTVTDDRYRAQMGKNNRARRAAKARSKARVKSKSRQQAQRRDRGGANGRPDGGAPGGAGNPFDEAYRVDPEGWTHGLLIEAASFQLRSKRSDRYEPDLHAVTLALLDRVPLDVLTAAGERVLLSCLGSVWGGGWQPVEVLRQARLNGSRAVTARLISEAIANDDVRRRAYTLDPRWIAQVDAMALPPADGKPGWVRRWIRAEQLDLVAARDVDRCRGGVVSAQVGVPHPTAGFERGRAGQHDEARSPSIRAESVAGPHSRTPGQSGVDRL